MKTATILALLLSSASAFAPSTTSSTSTSSLSASSINDAFGVSVETGNKCPPLGAKILEDASPEALKWFQNAEIKHGRIAMVATIGFWVQKSGIHMPLYLGPNTADQWLLSSSTGITFADVSAAAPLDAIQMVPMAGWLQIFFAAGAFESAAYYRQWVEGEGKVPGDYGYDPLGFTKREGGFDSEEIKRLRLNEIKNGRLAMMTIAAWVSSEVIPGSFPVWHP